MHIPFQIIEKAFDRNATSHELEELDKWRSLSVENETMYQILKNERLFTQKQHARLILPDKEKVWAQISQQISFRKPIRTYSLKELIAVAAMIAILFTTGGYAISRIHFGKAHKSLAYTTISAPVGQKSKALLPDGTQVWLNSGATVSYSNRFGGDNREISMSGEAYFDVAHNNKMPFRLTIDKEVSLTVLGTSFNVKSGANSIEVALNQGSVQLTNPTNNANMTILKPLERAVIEKRNGTLICNVEPMREFNDNTWLLTELKFENATFDEIISTLEKRYGVEITYSNVNTQKRYWMSLTTETPDETLALLNKIIPMTYAINNKQITIVGR